MGILDELKKDDAGSYLDSEGVSHDSLVGYLCLKLGFCGCGSPESALEYVRDGMRVIKDRSDSEYSDESSRAVYEWGGSNGERYFFWYRITELDLAEHGGSVPGWLTDKGRDFLDAIDRALAEEAKD